ncbi:hypothetical protein ES705_14036 [subsurface metagenome]
MKRKKYLSQFVFLLSFIIVMIGCEKDSDDPPPVVNQPPVFSGLNDLTLSPGFETHEIDFANFVTDQEGEIITYQVTNTDETVITISLAGSVLTITEVGPGSSDITVTATDGNEDHEVTETFTVTVEAITGAPDYSGNAAVMVDFNGLEGSVFDNPIPGWLFEGNTADGEYNATDIGSIMLEEDHLVITHNVEVTYIWSEMELDGNQDYTGKKFRFDYSFFTAPNLTGTHWEDDPPGVDIQIYFVDAEWGDIGGGQYRFSDMNLTYSADWQAVEIPLSDFESLWELPVDPSAVGVIGIEVWGGTASSPISFRLDNFGIVD